LSIGELKAAVAGFVENNLDPSLGTGDSREERNTAYGATVVAVSEFGWVRIRREKMDRQGVGDVDLQTHILLESNRDKFHSENHSVEYIGGMRYNAGGQLEDLGGTITLASESGFLLITGTTYIPRCGPLHCYQRVVPVPGWEQVAACLTTSDPPIQRYHRERVEANVNEKTSRGDDPNRP
jgi:hypothetical protein